MMKNFFFKISKFTPKNIAHEKATNLISKIIIPSSSKWHSSIYLKSTKKKNNWNNGRAEQKCS